MGVSLFSMIMEGGLVLFLQPGGLSIGFLEEERLGSLLFLEEYRYVY